MSNDAQNADCSAILSWNGSLKGDSQFIRSLFELWSECQMKPPVVDLGEVEEGRSGESAAYPQSHNNPEQSGLSTIPE